MWQGYRQAGALVHVPDKLKSGLRQGSRKVRHKAWRAAIALPFMLQQSSGACGRPEVES